jgi:adenylate cyclase
VVDKYIGDALMAVFGTLEDDEDAEFRAVSAALEFKLAITAMNEDRARFGKEPISIGVGLNTGIHKLM